MKIQILLYNLYILLAPEICFAQSDLMKILPSDLQQMNGKCISENGPNCLGTVLFAKGILKGIRLVEHDEFQGYVDSGLCKEVAFSDRKPGDISSVRQNTIITGYGAVHAFVWLDRDTVFEKTGDRSNHPFRKTTFEVAMKEYEGMKCAKSVGIPDTECDFFLNTYRCTSFDEYLAKINPDLKNELKTIREPVDQIECNLGKMYLGKGILGKETDSVFQTLSINSFQLEQVMDTYRFSDPEFETLNVLLLRNESLLNELQHFPGR